MYIEKLEKIGLSRSQSELYSLLINNGPMKGSELTEKSSISRQLVYKILDELIELDLVEKKDEKGSAAKFFPQHPSNLEKFISKKEEEIKNSKNELSQTINNLTSDFNLFSGQPGVQVFEGVEGVKKVLWDSLSAKGEILTYADVEPLISNIKEINDEYVKKRKKLGIKKRALVLDTEFARNYMGENYKKDTTTRFIENTTNNPFTTFVEIYDDKISYINFENNKLIGIIIQNKSISELNKRLFEFVWKKSEN